MKVTTVRNKLSQSDITYIIHNCHYNRLISMQQHIQLTVSILLYYDHFQSSQCESTCSNFYISCSFCFHIAKKSLQHIILLRCIHPKVLCHKCHRYLRQGLLFFILICYTNLKKKNSASRNVKRQLLTFWKGKVWSKTGRATVQN